MKRSLLIFIVCLSACIDPYTHPEIAKSDPFLVVDGFINPMEISKITLSYTQSLNLGGSTAPSFEIGAEVWVEDEQENKFSMTGDNQGNYYLAPNSIDTSAPAAYRLKIKLTNQKEYESEFVPVLTSPDIDSVTWGLSNNQEVELKVSTHNDLTEEPGYFRWTFDETWEYFSRYYSAMSYNSATGEVEFRQDNINKCWQQGYSTNISIESTTRFEENKVSEFVIDRFKLNSEKFYSKYSALVKQQSLTEGAYSYWKQIKKTNQDLGTIFGPLPSEVIGNFQSLSDPEERVIGYFSISSIKTKRIFITTQELPRPSQAYETPYGSCELFEIPAQRVNEVSQYLLVDPIYSDDGLGTIIAYTFSSQFCVDCRFRGGSTVQPEYWR
jgi:hypothetical protein